MAHLPIIVVGAGIGGLAAALALQRRGFTVRVFEQAPQVGDLGAGLQISANGSRVLIDLGLGEAMAAVTVPDAGRQIRLWSTGQTWTPYEISTQSIDRYGAPYWLVHRGDLHMVLLQAVTAADPAAVRLNARAIAVRPGDDSASITLDGGETVTGAVVIAADGVHSALRRQLVAGLLADGAGAQFTGKMAWRGLAPMDRLPEVLRRNVATNWVGVGRNVITYPVRPHVRSEGGALLNFVGIVERSDWTIESWSEVGSIEDCQADFEGWHPDVKAVIANLETPFRWALLSRPPLPQWTFGRVTMMGDAAHAALPFLGQGAVMAIEDGGVLGRCLDAHRNDLSAGLRQYEALRRPRTSQVVERSAAAAADFHNPALADADGAARFIGRSWAPDEVTLRYEWLYGYRYDRHASVNQGRSFGA